MAKKITIHPLYVYQNRTQNDIALIETEKAFDFTQLDKIAPICLPSTYFSVGLCKIHHDYVL